MTNHGRIGSYGLLINHDQRFLSEDNNRSVLDIIGNKNKETSPTPFGKLQYFMPHYIYIYTLHKYITNKYIFDSVIKQLSLL